MAIGVAQVKIAISIQSDLIDRVDDLVKTDVFRNRSAAIESAVRAKFRIRDPMRLARECTKLDPEFERALAEEGFARRLGRMAGILTLS